MKVTSNPSSASGQRYAFVYFAWTTSSRLANLKACPNVTFEPDLVTYNYDRKHYLSDNTQAWSTNMPNGYLDTAFGDSADELTWTVGTSDAAKLAANTQYRTYVRTTNGNASSDTSKVNAQKGVRIPSWCYSTWCVNSRQTVRYPTAGGTWLGIPGTWTWYR